MGMWLRTTFASTSRASSSGDELRAWVARRARVRAGVRCCPRIFRPMNRSACSWVKTPRREASSREPASASASSGSVPISCTMSRSLCMPMALSTTTMGTWSPSVLCFRYTLPFLIKILQRLLRSWVDEVIAAPVRPLLSTSMITRFLLSCSCMRITFSTPLTMKYPPGSYGHSRAAASWPSPLPASTHLQLRSMTGMRPTGTPLLTTSCRPRV
mmetsp:Transcript_1880/g.2966  ORF Transcript_1880/g.2966 Transcript_1880/m.2966 type:complete len:214 (-) Transcript_1880:430-1071(-)